VINKDRIWREKKKDCKTDRKTEMINREREWKESEGDKSLRERETEKKTDRQR
jgi:hypothetical protein